MVTLLERSRAYQEDYLHVRHEVIKHVIGTAIPSYFDVADEPYPEFSEAAYLTANPDIEDRVRAGDLESGYHHWLAEGQAEGRPLGL